MQSEGDLATLEAMRRQQQPAMDPEMSLRRLLESLQGFWSLDESTEKEYSEEKNA